MKKNVFAVATVLCLSTVIVLKAQSPLINHIYAADPSGHVWPDNPNKLWLYTSHDVNGTNHHSTMFDYHVFSTEDLVNWTDHGRVLSVDDVEWAISHAWAPDAVYWKGNYYFVFCMREKQNSDIFRLGLAISNRPEGPFKSIGMIWGPEGMDPSLFIDGDQPYIIYAHARTCYIAKLTDDLLRAVPGSTVKINEGLPQLQEGPWVHKYNNKYYLSYPGLRDDQWPEVMYVSVADNITGPYTPQNQYIPYFEGQAGSNHGSIVKFKGQWIAFYHAMILSEGNSYNRNLMADFITYKKDGTIVPIVPTKEGITGGKPVVCNIMLEAENGKASGGRLFGTYTESLLEGFSGNGYVTGFNHDEEYVEVLVQLARDIEYSIDVVYAAEGDRKVALLAGSFMLNGDYASWKDIVLPKTNGFNTYNLGTVLLKAGDTKLKFMSLNGDMKVDYFLLKPIEK
jgi:hypothetical protein